MPQRKRLALLAALPGLPLALVAARAVATTPTTAVIASGHGPGPQLRVHEAFPSRHVAKRRVRVWLPPDYDEGEACAVLYMHDGQNLFAPANPFNHGPVAVDTHLLALRAQGRVRKALVVAIDNTEADRAREFEPQAAIERLPRALRELVPGSSSDGRHTPLSDHYLRFLVEELKPFIDQHYRTRPPPEHTLLLGSSMGGLISLYALCRYPKVFGGMAGLSTHWPVTVNFELLQPVVAPEVETIAGAFLDWLSGHLPAPGRHRLYFDHGDQTLDALYAPFQRRMDAIAAQKGYRQGVDYESRTFPGASHDEAAWRARLAQPLTFLLSPGVV